MVPFSLLFLPLLLLCGSFAAITFDRIDLRLSSTVGDVDMRQVIIDHQMSRIYACGKISTAFNPENAIVIAFDLSGNEIWRHTVDVDIKLDYGENSFFDDCAVDTRTGDIWALGTAETNPPQSIALGLSAAASRLALNDMDEDQMSPRNSILIFPLESTILSSGNIETDGLSWLGLGNRRPFRVYNLPGTQKGEWNQLCPGEDVSGQPSFYAVGYTHKGSDADPPLASASTLGFVVAKFAIDGTPLWIDRQGEESSSIAADEASRAQSCFFSSELNQLLVTGSVGLTSGDNSRKNFVAAYSPLGNLDFYTLSGSGDQRRGHSVVYSRFSSSIWVYSEAFIDDSQLTTGGILEEFSTSGESLGIHEGFWLNLAETEHGSQIMQSEDESALYLMSNAGLVRVNLSPSSGATNGTSEFETIPVGSLSPALIMIGIAVIVLLLLGLVFIFVKLYSVRQLRAQVEDTRKATMSTSASFSSTQMSAATRTVNQTDSNAATSTQMTLTDRTSNVLALPGYLRISPSEIRRESQIGAGAFAHVYKASIMSPGILPDSQTQIVAKEIVESGERARALFVQEVAIICSLQSCPHIIRLFAYSDEPRLIMVLQFCNQGDLIHWNKVKPNSMRTLKNQVRIMRQVSVAVRAIHAARIVHSDLKSANILLHSKDLSDLQAYVSDFGVAAVTNDHDFKVHALRFHHVLGASFVSASPEVMLAFKTDAKSAFRIRIPQSDVYSLSMIIFAALCRREPWR